jgi:hypothetical protein
MNEIAAGGSAASHLDEWANGTGDTGSVGLFRREGRYWILGFRGERAIVPDSKGLRALAILLAYPRREFSASRLVELTELPEWSGAIACGEETRGIFETSLGPLLDDRAERAYLKEAESLREQIDEALEANDFHRAAVLREHLEMILDELRRARGLGGRRRPIANNEERARQKVRKNIKAAIDSLRRAHPPLSRHLSTFVKTGRYCAYDPDPDQPIRWAF